MDSAIRVMTFVIKLAMDMATPSRNPRIMRKSFVLGSEGTKVSHSVAVWKRPNRLSIRRYFLDYYARGWLKN